MERYIQMQDGIQIFTRQWQPLTTPIGHIHILHGMGEHSGRYEAFATALVAAGYQVSAHDHRGHGKTAERNNMPYGYFAKRHGFTQVVEDVEAVTQALGVTAPFILFGHSMGSFIARRYAQLYPQRLEKLIICGTGAVSPAQQLGRGVARVLAKLQGATKPSEVMNYLSFNSYNKHFAPARTDFDWLAANNEAVDAYIEDPYCGFVSTNRMYADLTDGIAIGSRQSEVKKTPNVPILLISGDEDPVGNNGQGVWTVAKQLTKAGKDHVQVYLVQGMRHEILNEKNNADTIAYIKRWLHE